MFSRVSWGVIPVPLRLRVLHSRSVHRAEGRRSGSSRRCSQFLISREAAKAAKTPFFNAPLTSLPSSLRFNHCPRGSLIRPSRSSRLRVSYGRPGPRKHPSNDPSKPLPSSLRCGHLPPGFSNSSFALFATQFSRHGDCEPSVAFVSFTTVYPPRRVNCGSGLSCVSRFATAQPFAFSLLLPSRPAACTLPSAALPPHLIFNSSIGSSPRL